MAMFPQPKKKKRPAPAGPKQNTRSPRKSTGGSNPLNRPAPNPTGGVAGGPSAPTRRSKPAGGYAKKKTKPAGYAKPAPVTAAQKKYAQQQTAKSALRAQGARLKADLKSFPKVEDFFLQSTTMSKIFPFITDIYLPCSFFFCICRPLRTSFFDFETTKNLNLDFTIFSMINSLKKPLLSK